MHASDDSSIILDTDSSLADGTYNLIQRRSLYSGFHPHYTILMHHCKRDFLTGQIQALTWQMDNDHLSHIFDD